MKLKKILHVTIEGEQSDIAKDLKAVLIENHRYKEALEDIRTLTAGKASTTNVYYTATQALKRE